MIGRSRALLKHVLIGLVVAKFQAGDQRRNGFKLQSRRKFPQGLRHGRGRHRIGRSKTCIRASGIIQRSSACSGSSGVLEDFSAQSKTPLIAKIMDRVRGDAVPPGIGF